MSTGQRKRVALIRALLHEPEVLFLDEPTSGLDPSGTRAVLDLIASLAGQGRTIVLCTHFLGEHTITGLANEDGQTSDSRNWQRYGTDAAYEAFVNDLNPIAKIKFTDNALTPKPFLRNPYMEIRNSGHNPNVKGSFRLS